MDTSNNREINGLVRVHYNQCDSTQSRTTSLVSKIRPREGFVVSTDYQSQGRGQVGSSWQSSHGLNLTMSLYLKPSGLEVQQQFLITIWVTQAICEVLKSYSIGKKIAIKWPNDILVGDRKIAGILVQNSLRGKLIRDVIIGVGINVRENMSNYSFPATSLHMETGRNHSISDLKERLIGKMMDVYKKGMQFPRLEAFHRSFEQQLWKLGEKVIFYDQGIKGEGRILGINKEGRLLLETEEKVRVLQKQDVQFILNEQ